MRKKLGWVTELPRHGQGCKEAINKLMDKPAPAHGVEVNTFMGAKSQCNI